MPFLDFLRRPNPLLSLLALFALAPFVLFYCMHLYIVPTLPDIKELQNTRYQNQSIAYDKQGEIIATFGHSLSFPVRYNQIPKQQVLAFLAAEDDDFFEHSGVDFKSLARAVLEAVSNSKRQSGGSTITMQVAKNYFLTFDRTIRRKLDQIYLARKIEQSLGKKQIFELYVNKIFLGHNSYGIAAAAKTYFGKSLNQLTIAESAMIAGLPKAPSQNNPRTNLKEATERRNWILSRMFQLGYISRKQYLVSRAEPTTLAIHQKITVNRAPYITDLVRSDIIKTYGEEGLSSGLRIYTTIDITSQINAQNALKQGIESYDKRHGWRGAEAKNQTNLDAFFVINDMEPALITKIHSDNTVDVLRRDGSALTLSWAAVGWARKLINANAVGAAPRTAKEVVDVGDVIRIRQDHETGRWKMVQLPLVQGAIAALNPQTGAIESLVGGYDYFASKYNRATQSKRQLGSTIKPFIFAYALEKGFTPFSIVSDAPMTSGSWKPKNSDGRYSGDMPLRTALLLSRNLPSIRLLQSVGLTRTRNQLAKYGIDQTLMPKNLTLALGAGSSTPLQVAVGYAVFANGGYRIQPYVINHITDINQQVLYSARPYAACARCLNEPALTATVKTVEKADAGVGKTPLTQPLPPINYLQAPQVLDTDLAIDMANMLRDVIQSGTANTAKAYIMRKDIGGKTGTTNNNIDAWFAGFHPSLAAVTWLGFDSPRTLGKREYGGVTAIPIWAKYMSTQLENKPYQWLTIDDNVGQEQTISQDPTADITEAEREAERRRIQKRLDKLRPPMIVEIKPTSSSTRKEQSTPVLNTTPITVPQALETIGSTSLPPDAVNSPPKTYINLPPP